MVAAVAAIPGTAAASADGCVHVPASAYNRRRPIRIRKIFNVSVTAEFTVCVIVGSAGDRLQFFFQKLIHYLIPLEFLSLY